MIKMRLVTLLSDSRKYIVYNVIWQWLALLANIAAIASIGILLERAINKEQIDPYILPVGAVLVLSVIIRHICTRNASKASFYASKDVKQVLREKLYEKLLLLGPSYQEAVSDSEVMQVSVEGVEQLETYYGKYLPQLFYSLLAPLTLFCFLVFVNWKASFVLLICVPLIPVSIVAVQKFARKLLNKYWGSYTELGDSFLENLQGLTTLKIYQADEKKAMEMDEESERFRKITMRVLTMQLNSISVMDLIAYGGAAIGMIVAVKEYIAGNTGFAGTFMILLLAADFFIPLRLLGSFFHIAMNGMAASDKIFRILDLPEYTETMRGVEAQKTDICLKDVSFAYEADREVLKKIQLSIPAGSMVSLVGTSGCGKSTAASILMGRKKGYQGSIQIGGVELSQIKESSLMDTITLVNFNSHLFKGTVEENLRMGNPKASKRQLEEALLRVNLLDFVNSQDGLSTKIMENGSNFSGGQRQRLALARALLHDTPIYIFDEATSNIDVESEEMIMNVIRELAKQKTVLLISHRLANVVDSDCIYVLKDGVIAERGTHNRLLAQNGVYAQLYNNQQKLEAYGQGAKNGENEEDSMRRENNRRNRQKKEVEYAS